MELSKETNLVVIEIEEIIGRCVHGLKGKYISYPDVVLRVMEFVEQDPTSNKKLNAMQIMKYICDGVKIKFDRLFTSHLIEAFIRVSKGVTRINMISQRRSCMPY